MTLSKYIELAQIKLSQNTKIQKHQIQDPTGLPGSLVVSNDLNDRACHINMQGSNQVFIFSYFEGTKY